MKNITFILLMSVFAVSAWGQNYVRLGDVSEIVFTPTELDSLEAAATELKNEMPSEFSSDFNIIDAGFYSYNEIMDIGLETYWKQVIAPYSSEFYIIFGRKPDSEGNHAIIFKLKLPTEGIFSCYTLKNLQAIEGKISQILSTCNTNDIKLALRFLKDKIVELKGCCIPGLRTQCTICLSGEELNNMYVYRDTFFTHKSTISIDSTLFKQGSSTGSNLLIGEGYWVLDYNEKQTPIIQTAGEINDICARMGFTFKAYVTSNSTTCTENAFEEIEAQFNNSTAQIRLRLHVNEEKGEIYEYTNWHTIANFFGDLLFDYYDEILKDDKK